MNFEQPVMEEEKSQEQLAQEYLAAYEEYKEISDMRSNHLRVLDSLEDETAPKNMIDEQRELFMSLHDKEKAAMERYVKIGEKLAPETRDKFLK